MNSLIAVLLALSTIVCVGCTNEDGAWQSAETKNTISAYEKFVRQYPDSARVPEAVTRLSKLPTFAKVVVEHPKMLTSRASYHNIEGPVWVFEIKFKEVNGISATIDSKLMRIYGVNGSVWGDRSFEEIFDESGRKKIKIKL